MLEHTDGIRGSLLEFRGISFFNSIGSEERYNLITKQKEINFSPGEKYLYGNSGYFLLGKIIEKVSGQSLRKYAQENIFGPLGMKSTFFSDDNHDLIKNRAFSYSKKNGEEGFNNLIIRSVGGVYTNIKDLALWDNNFYNNKLGKGGQLIIQKWQEYVQLNNGENTGNYLVIEERSYKGLKTGLKLGSFAGYGARI